MVKCSPFETKGVEDLRVGNLKFLTIYFLVFLFFISKMLLSMKKFRLKCLMQQMRPSKPSHWEALSFYRQMVPHYRRQWRPLAGALISLGLSVGVGLLAPWPLKLILDHLILNAPLPDMLSGWEPWFTQQPLMVLGLLAVSLVILQIAEGICSYLNKFLLGVASQRMLGELRERVFAHLQQRSLFFHQRNRAGDLTQRLLDNVMALKDMLFDIPQVAVFQTFTFVAVFAVMAALNWRLALLAVVLVPVVFWVGVKFKARVRRISRDAKKAEGQVAASISQNMGALPLIQAYGLEASEQKRFERVNKNHLTQQLKVLNLSKSLDRIIELLMAVSTALVLYAGAQQVWAAQLLPGDLVVFVAYLKQVFDAPGKLSGALLGLGKGQAVAERVGDLLEQERAIDDDANTTPAPRLKGRIQFQNVDFSYEENRPVLRAVSMNIEPGQTVALVGHNGAGKSTLVSLLLRFYDPDRGQVLIDDTDIRMFQLKSLRNQMAVVLQDAALFNTTIRDNIAMGRPDASEAGIVEAARQAQIHDFITSLPQGYNTVVEEGGANLSGGQRQRIHMARALLRDTPIVILDEPATGVDTPTEAKLNDALRLLTKGKTTLMIAHRLSSVEAADHIFVMKDGRLIAQGTHAELLESSQDYRDLYDLNRTHVPEK